MREPFLETELSYLSTYFHKVYLLVPKQPENISHTINFKLPPNVIVAQFNDKPTFIQKLLGLKVIFTYRFWKEISVIKLNYNLKLNRQILKILMSSLIRSLYFAQQIKKFLKSNHIPFHRTTLYTYWCNEYSAGIGIFRKKYKVAGAFTRVHNWDLYFERADHNYLPLRSFIHKTLDATFVVSEQTKKYILKKIPYINEDKLLVNYLGVEKIAEPLLNNKGKKLKILSLAFLGKVKRIDMVVAALEMIENIEIEWHHIGEGNDHLDLKQYAFNHLFNKSNIRYVITGDIPKKNVYEYLKKEHFDVLINTSSFEGVPVSMMEAMSFSIPVIGTNVGGVSEIIDDGKNGYLLPANPSTKEIVDTLTKLYLLSDEEYLIMRNNAYQTWKNKFNAEYNYPELAYNMLQFSKNR